MNLLKSEFRKIMYTKNFFGYTAGAIFIAVLSSWGAAFSFSHSQKFISGASLMDPGIVDSVYAKSTSGYLFAILLGVVFMGNEFQNGMAISTFLATPKRIKVLYAKLIIASCAGVLLMLISTGVGLLAAYIGLRGEKHAAPDSATFFNLILAAVISGAVLSVMGIAVGALVRNVRIASAGVVIWLGVIERLIVVFWTTGGKYLPSGLILGMLNLNFKISAANKVLNINSADYFGALTATLLLLVYATVFAAAGVFTSLRRDVN